VDKDTSEPIAGATVRVKGLEAQTDATGQATIADVPIGPVPVDVTAQDYKPLQEVVSVVNGKTSALALSMVLARKRVPATISGLVRSTAGGRPVSATVEIPQARIRASANANGAFSFKIVGGTYNVVISAPGYLTQSKSVTVREGDEAIFNVDLHPDKRR
jgi:Carboxypeptidase regulatory-like domain